MNCLRRLCFPWPRRVQVRPVALSSSILRKVPVEILLHIMDFLPLESAISFSLSCMKLKFLLGTQHLLRLLSSTKDTLALLDLLARDLPNQVVCYACQRLHHMKDIRKYNVASYATGIMAYRYCFSRLPACVSQDQYNHTDAITTLFGTTAFKMAIKRYQQDPECTKLLTIMSSKALKTIKMGEDMWQFREDCRIIRGRLMHRLQSVYVSPKLSTSMPFDQGPIFRKICPHINFSEREMDIGAGLKRCQQCRTEYRFDSQYYGSYGMAIFYTRWKDLGIGPEYKGWVRHLPSLFEWLLGFVPVRDLAWNSVGPQLTARFRVGALSSAYEGRDDFKFDSMLTSECEAKLLKFQKQSFARARWHL